MAKVRKASLALVVAILSLLSANADAHAQVPRLPHLFYGTITIDGNPAPVGTVVTVTVGGRVQDSIAVTRLGVYGGPSALEDKLLVQDSGTVHFLANGVEAEQSVVFKSGEVTELALSFAGNAASALSSQQCGSSPQATSALPVAEPAACAQQAAPTAQELPSAGVSGLLALAALMGALLVWRTRRRTA